MPASSTVTPAGAKPPSDFRERMLAYNANRPSIPGEELQRHAGKWVAITWDGKAIVAYAPDFTGLMEELDRAGIDDQAVSFEYVSPVGFSDVGGIQIENEPCPEPSDLG